MITFRRGVGRDSRNGQMDRPVGAPTWGRFMPRNTSTTSEATVKSAATRNSQSQFGSARITRSRGVIHVVTSRITPRALVILADPNWLWLFLVAALFTVASLVVDVFLGMNRPHVGAPTGRSIWPFLESLPTPRRNVIIENLRLQQVYEALYQTGVDIALEGTPIDGIRRWFERHILGEVRLTEDESAPQRVGALLQQLGPTYVKIGQMMASRSDILPVDWTTEFARLQSDAEPFPWKDAWIVLRSELGRPPEELFATIEEQPFAAASTAQVQD